MTDHDYEPPSRRELAIELGEPLGPTVTRKSLRSGGGLRVDVPADVLEERYDEWWDIPEVPC